MLLRLLGIMILLLGASGLAPADARSQLAFAPEADAEAFVRQELRAGRDVDLNRQCGGDFDPGSVDDVTKAPRCRTMSGSAFAQLLRDKEIAPALAANGYVLAGLVVEGDVELRWTDVTANVICRTCLFGGKLLIEGARFEHGLRFEGGRFMAGLDARAAQVRGRVSFLAGTTIGGTVDLSTAVLSDMLETNGAKFEAKLDLSKAKVGLVRFADTTFAGGIQADDAVIGGTFTLDDRTKILGKGFVARGMAVGSYFKFGEASGKGGQLGGTSEVAGLNLTSARLKAGLEIANTRVGSQSEVIDDPRFTSAGIVLIDASIEGALRIDGATLDGAVDADGVSIAKELQSRRTAYGQEVSLKRAAIGGDLEIADKSLSTLTAEKLHVGGSLELENVKAAALDLKGASIDADVDLVNVAVADKLELDQASIGKHLAIEGDTTVGCNANFAGLSTSDLVIGIDQDFPKARVRFLGEADFSRIKVANSVFMRRVTFEKQLLLVAADIKSHLDIATAQIAKLDMTRTSVGGDFRLAERAEEETQAGAPRMTIWPDDAKLMLKNAHVGVIQDENETTDGKAWPAKVELLGFGYDHFGTTPKLKSAEAWLGRDAFSPEPFVQLAKYYNDAGHKEEADKVLYQAKWNETAAAWRDCVQPDRGACAHAIGLTALGALIGYGIGNGLFQALIWVVLLTLFGAFVIRWTRDENQQRVEWGGPGKGMLWCVGASANHLIPLVELNGEFKKFFDDPKRERLSAAQLMYFAGHAVAGYVLASFVAAAVAGLTQSH